MKCIICSNETKHLDDYKVGIDHDKEYFGDLKINHCSACNFAFCNPMPDSKKLDSFYENIYRSSGRPHQMQLDSNYYNDQIFNYIQYISTFVDFNNITNVFDFGAGTGDLGYVLKKRFNHLKLSTIENDKFARKVLKDRSYDIYDSFSEIEFSFDLIISTHCFEHLTDLDVINHLKNKSHNKTFLFIEVPNNNFDDLFLKRPYDSPHTIFFSKNSFHEIEKKYNMKAINISTASFSIEEDYKRMAKEKIFYKNWLPNKKSLSIKESIKKLVPVRLMSLIKFYRTDDNERISNFSLNDDNSTALRAIYKINS